MSLSLASIICSQVDNAEGNQRMYEFAVRLGTSDWYENPNLDQLFSPHFYSALQAVEEQILSFCPRIPLFPSFIIDIQRRIK